MVYGPTISAVPPGKYAIRFVEFIQNMVEIENK